MRCVQTRAGYLCFASVSISVQNSFIPDPVTLHVRRAIRDFVLTVTFIVFLIISNVLLRNNGQNI